MNVRDKALQILMQNNLPLGHNFKDDDDVLRTIAEANLEALDMAGIVLVDERHDEIFWAAFHRIEDALELLREYEHDRLESWVNKDGID